LGFIPILKSLDPKYMEIPEISNDFSAAFI